jgi:hypothetical protein
VRRQQSIPFAFIGTVEERSEVRIETEYGSVYEGQFEGPAALTGVYRAGADNDPRLPKVPFRFVRVRAAQPSDFPPPLPATTSDWNVFLARFRSAVRLRNTNTLTKLMARRFGLDENPETSPDELFGVLNRRDRYWDGWKLLTEATSVEAKPCRKKPPMVFACKDFIYRNTVWVTLMQGSDRQWRWDAFVTGD